MPSEIRTAEDVRRYLAELDATQPVGDWREIQEREFERRKERDQRERERERERKAREVRKAEEKQQRAVANNWDAWYAAIDARIEQHFLSGDLGVGGALKAAIGDALGKKAAQVRDEFKRAIEEMRCALETKLAEQREHFLASNSQATWVAWVDDRIKATFGFGRDVLLAEVKDVVEGVQRSFEVKLTELEQRLKAVPGKLPVAKIWCPESVSYQAEFVCHEGALWQACRDTAQAPGGSDWLCVARAGCDAVTPKIRGAYDVHKTYARLDIVECDGAGYLARRDAPGVPGFPGDGWQLMSRSGSRGPAGEIGPRGRKGERGARGEDAPEITGWHLERETYRVFPVFADGKMGPELNLRGLFEQYQVDIS
jgi:hypothetical protein